MRAITSGTPEQAEGAQVDDWQPAIVTPMRNVQEWEWSQAVRPPAIPGSFQESWAKVASPFRLVALSFLWITWHWARFAALAVVLVLIAILIIIN